MILAMLTIWGCSPVSSNSLSMTAALPRQGTEAPGEAHPGWMAEVSARLRDASRAFEPEVGGYRAQVVERGMIARFDNAGAHLSVGDDVIHVSTVGWGRDQRTEDDHRPAPALGACFEERIDPAGDCVRRLEYSEAGRTEWWAGRDDGFQQGWTVETPVPGDGALTIEIAVSGGYVVGDDADLWIQGDGGGVVLVSGLEAHDADGTTLDIRFEVVEAGFLLRVADAGARYPIAIDPVYTTPSWTVDGQEADGFGSALSGAGDVDNDGYDDVIVGAPDDGSYTGRAYVFHGSSSGLSSTAATTLTGPTSGIQFGGAVSGAGDVDDDGYDDVIVGAIAYDSYRGGAFVYLGSSAGVSTTAIATLSGEAESNYLGGAVSDAGDVNGDGYADVLVGAWGYGSLTGRAYVYLGSSSGVSSAAAATLTGEATENYFAWSVSDAGDVDGDGYDDVIVGAPLYDGGAGRAYVYLGSSGGVSSAAATTLSGGPDDSLGRSVSRAGDVDNDGYDDVIVGAYYGDWTSTGQAYVHLGSSSGLSGTPATTLTAEAAADSFGAVAAAGDVNNDGYADVIVGAAGHATSTGRVYVYLGSSTGVSSTAVTTLTGEEEWDNFGSVMGAGDVNNDGYSDVIIGGAAARADVYLGSSAGVSGSAATTLTGVVSSETLGESVSRAGDVNNDGFDDVIVGASGYDRSTGRAYVFHGSSAGLSSTADTTLTGAAIGDAFGCSVSDAGDVDNDGYDDVIVGGDGRAYVFHGSSTGVSATATTTTDRASDDEQARSVSGAGDVNGDGYADVIVGASTARYEPYGSRALVYLGSASGVSATESTALSGDDLLFGASVSGLGDVDHDGYDDVIVGSPGAYGGSGSAFVYLGSASGLSTTAEAELSSGATEYDGYGSSVSGAGDVNDDGYDDVLVGAASYSSSGGRAFVYDGDGVDGDGDGYSVAIDCDDADATISPGATEVCNGIDDDCDALVDDEDSGVTGVTTWYADTDGDAFGDPDASVARCTVPAGYVADGSDCDDTDGSTNPAAVEVPGDATDQDCDGSELCYIDADGDGYRGGDDTIASANIPCDGAGEAPATAPAGDCDDGDAAFHPGAAEADCTDPADYNCDDSTGRTDADSDGFAACEECDDASAAVHPGAEEVCNDLDDDCDGTTDVGASDSATWYADRDADGYTDADNSVIGCAAPAGYVAPTAAPDCDDADPTVSPGADDLPGDGIDQDCDGADATGEDIAADTDSETDKGTGNGCGCGANSRSGGWPMVGWAALLAASLRRRV